MFPSRDHHWRNAYRLMALGGPLALGLALTQGLWVALIFLAAAASILRWPVWFAWKRVRGLLRRA
jgi:Flp pilus assembly protein TadB